MSTRTRYIKSFNSILCLGNFIGVSQFTLSNSKCLSFLSSIQFVPFLVGYLYLAHDSYKFSKRDMLAEEVVILSYGIWIVFCINLLATLSRFPYYFLSRRLFKRVILDVNEINKRLRLAPKYAKQTLKIWSLFFIFVGAKVLIVYYSDLHWSIKFAFVCGGMMQYCEIMFAYKILNEMSLQCEHLHGSIFEGLHFIQENKLGKADGKYVSENHNGDTRAAYLEHFLELTQVHLQICRCAKEANSLFGPPIMSLVILDFAVVTLTLYDVCSDIVDLNLFTYTWQYALQIIGNCLQIGIIFSRQIISIYSWTRLNEKLKETVLNTHKLWNILSINNQIGKWAGCIQLTTIQLSNAIPQFSASGIVDIDWPVIISIVSAASTYVVILIQFGTIKRTVHESSAGGSAPTSSILLFPA